MLTRRGFGAAASAALGVVLLSDPLAAQAVAYDAVVSKGGLLPGGTGSGIPQFRDIGSALRVAQASRQTQFRIYIGPGTWRERLVIDRPGITLTGAGTQRTLITAGAYAGIIGPDGKQIGTFQTATVRVTAPDFSVSRLTIANDFDYDNTSRDRAGNGAQAVALALQDKADRSLLRDVVLTGHQDTLYVDAGRSLFQDCKILGCVDFIFGAGQAFFENCQIVSLKRPDSDFNGYVAAPDTSLRQPVGLVFHQCHLYKGKDVASQTVALGRPWRNSAHFPDGFYGDPDSVGACAYIDCWMDDHIVPEGWRSMGYYKKGGVRAMFPPEKARFFEYGSRGPGAGKPSATRRMLTEADLQTYTRTAVLKGWME